MLLLAALLSAPAMAQEEAAASEAADAKNPHAIAVQGNSIRLTFDPAVSASRPSCTDIRHVQILRMDSDGTAILPGTLRKKDAWLDATASDGGWVIDSVVGPDKPYYQEDTDSRIGRSEPHRVAVLDDEPRLGVTPDHPPYDPEAAPSGWKEMIWRFKSFAVCAAGPDCGAWYDGVSWTFTQTAARARAGEDGVTHVFVPYLPPAPAGHDAPVAFERYAKAKGFTACQ